MEINPGVHIEDVTKTIRSCKFVKSNLVQNYAITKKILTLKLIQLVIHLRIQNIMNLKIAWRKLSKKLNIL